MTAIVEACQNSHHCEPMKALLDECNERVSGKSKTEETCTQELFDFIHCVDHCVSIEIQLTPMEGHTPQGSSLLLSAGPVQTMVDMTAE